MGVLTKPMVGTSTVIVAVAVSPTRPERSPVVESCTVNVPLSSEPVVGVNRRPAALGPR